jgi:hypothetical protein
VLKRRLKYSIIRVSLEVDFSPMQIAGETNHFSGNHRLHRFGKFCSLFQRSPTVV